MKRQPTADPAAVSAWCRALFAQLHTSGVEHVAISPGSRSTPLAVAADLTPGLGTSIHLDERSGGFFALGLAKATRRPVALICTSGTAAANYLPAVVEAFHSGVPLVVITADRPPELQGRGAPQTIDQTVLYGSHLRLAREALVAGLEPPKAAIALAAELVEKCLIPISGPVHLNCPLREPLEPPQYGPEPVTTLTRKTDQVPSRIDEELLTSLLTHPRGLVVVGPIDLAPTEVEAIAKVGQQTGWPLVADPGSGLRRGPHTVSTPVVATGEHLFRSHWINNYQPDVVLQLGTMPTSKAYRLWLRRNANAKVVAVNHLGWHPDPEHVVTHRFDAKPVAFAEEMARLCEDRGSTDWTESWMEAEALGSEAIAEVVANTSFDEPAVVVGLGLELEAEARLVVANSMPIRDLDAFLTTSTRPMRILSNRGASGIDGLVSTASGVAHGSQPPTVLFTGDLALLHDLSGLAAVQRLEVDLTIVVVDNNGGGIFSFLPVAHREHIDHQRLFHTPHGLDLGLAAKFVGAALHQPDDPKSLAFALGQSVGQAGLHLIHVAVSAQTNVAIHRQATEAVDKALG